MVQTTDKLPYGPPPDTRPLVLEWLRRARNSQLRHYMVADRLANSGRNLGVAVIAITSLTGTTAFLSLIAIAVSPLLRVAVGLTSMSAAVLATLQTFLRYSERAELHHKAGAQYGAVRRRLEALHAEGAHNDYEQEVALARDELDLIAQNSPHLPRRAVEP